MTHVGPALLAAFALLLVVPAARAATILHLEASATVMVAPDELEAELAAPGQAASPAAAQAQVNALMAAALVAVRRIAAVRASTGGYAVWRPNEPKDAWRASETLSLTSENGPALLALVGALQAKGLTVSSLAWRLAPATERAAREKAEATAITKLEGRAEAVAKLLGLRFEAFREVWLNPPARPPIQPMLAATRAVPAPEAIAAPEAVSASVTADATLVPPSHR